MWEGRRVFFGGGVSSRCPAVSWSRGLVVSWSYWRATQAFSVILSHSQAFPVNRAPSSRPAVSSSRCLVVPESVWVGKNLPAMREDDPQSERGAAYLEEIA